MAISEWKFIGLSLGSLFFGAAVTAACYVVGQENGFFSQPKTVIHLPNNDKGWNVKQWTEKGDGTGKTVFHLPNDGQDWQVKSWIE